MDWGSAIGSAGSGAMAGGSIGGPWGAAIGGGVGLLNSFLNNPHKGAESGLNQGWKEAQKYQSPFWQHGMDQYDPLNQARQNLMDPSKLQGEWASSYETSPYAKRMLENNMQQGQEAASAMGLNGSSAATGNIQQGAGDIVSRDRQQYMDDMMKKYMAGIGLGQDIYGKGASAGQNLGNQAYGHGENMAQLNYDKAAAPGEALGQGAGMLFNSLQKGGGNKWNANNIPAYAKNAMYG